MVHGQLKLVFKVLTPATFALAGVGFIKHHEKKKARAIALNEAISQAETIITGLMHLSGCPGLSVAVSINGTTVWKEGFGLSDVENKVPCKESTVMKTASISKPITMAILAQAWEENLLDWDTPVQHYVTYWPQKQWQSEQVDLTVSQLCSHLSGLRDYKKMEKNTKQSDDHQEFKFEEYYIKRRFRSTKEAVGLFKDDPLVGKPGESFHYTTHGFTLLAAAIEGATKKTFSANVKEIFAQLGMSDSYLDRKNKIIYNNARYYCTDKKGNMVNAPFTESSFKWAGAGMLSTVNDLVKFGNAMLYSYQNEHLGMLKPSTVRQLWRPVHDSTVSWDSRGRYGMGWQIVPITSRDLKCRYINDKSEPGNRTHNMDEATKGMDKLNQNVREENASDDNNPGSFVVGHTGGTIGASSALLILPLQTQQENTGSINGIVVTVLCNFQGLSLGPVALDLLKVFMKMTIT